MIRSSRSRSRSRARLVPVLGLVVALVLESTGAATAEVPERRNEPVDHTITASRGVEVRGPVRVTDPVDFAKMPWADVRSITLATAPNAKMRVEMTTQAFSPLSHADWVVGRTEADWALDTNGDRRYDWVVALFVRGDGKPVAGVYKRGSNTPRCKGVIDTKASARRYSVTFKQSCIGSPKRVRGFVVHSYDDTELLAQREDFAPDDEWTPWLRLGGGTDGPTAVPGAPGTPKGTGAPDAVDLTWTAPTTGGRSITSYTVQARAQVPAVQQRPSTRIVGGTEIDISDAPWQVGLIIDDQYLCGGTIIEQRWILTAAHCTDETTPGGVDVYAGITNTSNWSGAAQAVDRVIVHPGWNPDTNKNDVALLRLAAPIQGGTPIRLYKKTNGPSAGTAAFVSGWGRTDPNVTNSSPDVLNGVTISVLSGPSGGCGDYGSDFDATRMLCAGVSGGGKDSCQGDSGGPLVVPVGSTWELAGVVSFGIGCAQAQYPGVYARVSTYVPWIYDTLGWTVKKSVPCTSACLSTRVSGLVGGTDYVFRVAATNAVGRGAWSKVSAVVRAEN